MGMFSRFTQLLAPRSPLDGALRETIERAVDTVEPLMRMVSGYERKLAPAVRHALDYCAALAASVPGSIDVSQQAFGTDSLVHSLFASSGDIGDMLGKSRELRGFLAEPATCPGEQFYALLGMRKREKAVMGMAMRGDMVQREVPQRLLYFADHTLGEFGGDVESTRQRLRTAAFDGLTQSFARCIEDLRKERRDSRTEWQLQRAAAREIRGERHLVLEERQRQAIASLVPERVLEAFVEWLAAPEGRLYLKPTVVTVDRMGVISNDPDAGGSFSTLNFPELVGRDQRHWIVVVARIGRADALEALRRQQEANRYLII